MKHIKRFNEEFDPMGSWDPKHPSNTKEEENELTSDQDQALFRSGLFIRSLVRNELSIKIRNTYYDRNSNNKNNLLDDRITQLLKIHNTWLDRIIENFVKLSGYIEIKRVGTYPIDKKTVELVDDIVDRILKYEKNLNNGLGPLSQR